MWPKHFGRSSLDASVGATDARNKWRFDNPDDVTDARIKPRLVA